MQDFHNLKVWEKAHRITLSIYKASQAFPKEEMYGITSQIRRAVMSIPANIAEGCSRSSEADFNRFLQIALGSATEVEYFLLLAKDLTYLSESDHQRLYSEIIGVKQMLTRLMQTIRYPIKTDSRKRIAESQNRQQIADSGKLKAESCER